MDRTLSELFNNDNSVVGLVDGAPFSYPLLAPPAKRPTIPEELMREWKTINPQAQSGIDQASDALETIRLAMGAYVGWLLTDKTFVAARGDLLTTWATNIAQFGIP
jgi:hypothetical protein